MDCTELPKPFEMLCPKTSCWCEGLNQRMHDPQIPHPVQKPGWMFWGCPPIASTQNGAAPTRCNSTGSKQSLGACGCVGLIQALHVIRAQIFFFFCWFSFSLNREKWSKIRKQSLFESEWRALSPPPPCFFPTLTSQWFFFLLAAVSGIGDNCQ